MTERPASLRTRTRPLLTGLIALFYYLVFVPVAWIVRMVHDPLDREWDAARASYFERRGTPSRR